MEKFFTMTQKGLSLYHALIKVEEEGLKQVKAAELLGISDRHFRRLLKAYRREGVTGISSKKRGKPSNNRMSEELKRSIEDKLKNKYNECGPTFAWEKLLKVEKIDVSVETVRKIMIELGLWKSKRRKRLKLYQRRMRRECEGELIQMDGSPHKWLEERGEACCLIGYIDDATSKIKHLKFVEAETSKNYFLTLKEYMKKHGKPKSFYSDRFSVFRVNNDKEGYRKFGLTQVGRGLKELGIELICANSPQAKGRVERLFGTLQDRLVKELRLRKISTLEEANAYLEEYIEEHNALFSVAAENAHNMHESIEEKELERCLCYKEERTLSKNLEISYEGRILQVITEEAGYRMRGAKVLVKEDLEGKISIEYQGKELEFKELLVKDHQGRVANKKEILLGRQGALPLKPQQRAVCPLQTRGGG